MNQNELKEKLREVFNRSADGPKPISERDALEAALDVASEWQMRLNELDADDGE